MSVKLIQSIHYQYLTIYNVLRVILTNANFKNKTIEYMTFYIYHPINRL